MFQLQSGANLNYKNVQLQNHKVAQNNYKVAQSNYKVAQKLQSCAKITKLRRKDVVSSFMKLFWKEQNKYLCINPKARKYHPMIIRFCPSL